MENFALDFFGGWSKLLPRSYYINNRRTYILFNLGVNNLLNSKDIRSGGFEQLRFDLETKMQKTFHLNIIMLTDLTSCQHWPEILNKHF